MKVGQGSKERIGVGAEGVVMAGVGEHGDDSCEEDDDTNSYNNGALFGPSTSGREEKEEDGDGGEKKDVVGGLQLATSRYVWKGTQ